MPPARVRMGVQVCLDQSWLQRCSRTRPWGKGWTRRRSVRGRARRVAGVRAAHLDDERVLKHGIPHDPQPLVLHSRPDVGHGQGPPRRRADVADRAAHRLLLLPSHEVLTGALGLWHPGGHGESTRELDPARFPAWGRARSSEGPTASPGPHHSDTGVGTGRRAPSEAGRGNLGHPLTAKRPKGQYKPLWFLGASSGGRAAVWERRKKIKITP